MQITFSPGVNNSKRTHFCIGSSDSKSIDYYKNYSEKNSKKSNSYESSTSPKGIVAKLGYAWVNFSEGTKGFIKGIFYGMLTTVGICLYKTVKLSFKKYKNKEIKFSEMFHYKKVMTKPAKFLAVMAGGTVFAANLVIATLKANQRSANVDHMLYDGHRSKINNHLKP